MGRLTVREPGLSPARVRRLVVVAILLHLVATIFHGITHEIFSVPLLWWQSVAVASTLLLGPIAGGGLVWRGRVLLGSILVVASLSVAVLFELVAHFLLANPGNPDYVGAVATGQLLFATTAVAGILTDLLGIFAGLFSIQKR